MVFFLVALIIAMRLGVQTNDDTNSYFYLLNGSFIENIPDLVRPLGYPLFFLLTVKLLPSAHFHSIVILQSALYALSAMFLYLLASRMISNRLCLALCMLFLLFNYNTTSYVSLLGPETLTLFLITAFVCYVGLTLHRLSNVDSIVMIVLMTFLAFTKPNFLYYPICVACYMLFLKLFRVISLHQFAVFILSSVLLFIVPVVCWSYGNKIRSNYFTFSVIQEINITEKVIRYDLWERGPKTIDGVPVKTLLQKLYTKNTTIYGVMQTLQNSVQPSDLYTFPRVFSDFGRITFLNNLPTYVAKSIQLVPQTFFLLIPIKGVYYQLSKSHAIVSATNVSWASSLIHAYISTYITLYFSVLTPMILLFVGLGIVYVIHDGIAMAKKEITKEEIFFIFLFATVLYYSLIVDFGAYDQFDRMFAPMNFVVILLFFMVTDRTISIVKTCIHATPKRIKR